MDLATIIGVFLGMGLIGGAIWIMGSTAGVDTMVFVDVQSLMIVMGGTLAATAIAFPLREVMRLMSVMGAVFKGGKLELTPIVDEVVDLASVARKGTADLEKAIGDVNNPFLRDGVQMVVDGYSADEIREILGTRVVYREERERSESQLFRSMGKYSPAFGMIGTLIGLVYMLKGMGKGGEDMASAVGSGMAAALITTFYGAFLANMFFLPMSDKLASQVMGKSTMQNMITEGVCLLQMRKHPLIVREKINSFIPPREWKQMEEK